MASQAQRAAMLEERLSAWVKAKAHVELLVGDAKLGEYVTETVSMKSVKLDQTTFIGDITFNTHMTTHHEQVIEMIMRVADWLLEDDKD